MVVLAHKPLLSAKSLNCNMSQAVTTQPAKKPHKTPERFLITRICNEKCYSYLKTRMEQPFYTIIE